MSIVNCVNLSKIYKSPVCQATILKDVHLKIEQGSFVAIMGKSGSGKSALLNILGGLDSEITGVLEVDGKSLESLNDSQLADFRGKIIGFVFQNFYLQPHLSVLQNVGLPLNFQNFTPEEIKNKSKIALESVGLEDKSQYLPYQLSGGQMQRVAIARSIVTQPMILLADEPTGNLDSKTSEEIVELLMSINKNSGTTLIIVTHDEDIAKKGDCIYELVSGELTKIE